MLNAAAMASTKGVVNTDDVNVRSGPSTTTDVLTTADKGEKLTLHDADKDGWYKVTVNGKTGYIRADKVNIVTSSAATAKVGDTVYADKDGVNLRARASTSASVVKKLEKGDKLVVKDVSGDWYKVKAGSDTGYVRADVTMTQKPATTSSASDKTESSTSTKKQGPVVHDGDDEHIPDITGLDEQSAAVLEAATDTEEDHEDEDEVVTETFDDEEPNIGEPGTYMVAGAPQADGVVPDNQESVTSVTVDNGAEASGEVTDTVALDSVVTSNAPMSTAEMQRELSQLGFYSGKDDGKLGTYTLAALKSFQRAYDLEIDGKLGEQTVQTIRAAVATGGNGTSAARVQTSQGVIMAEWFNYMKTNFPKYEALRCVDVATGESFKLRAFSCGNHADVEPPTKADTEALKRINGGQWSWTPRAIWVYIDGQPYAAAINVKPHGPDTLPDNGMAGQICMHFLHSRAHNTGQENKNLQAAVLQSFAQASKAPR